MSVAIWVGYPRSYTPGRVRPPQFVTLHYTAGSEGPTSAENGAQYDKTRTDGTSCHYFVDSEGPALQEVPDGDRSHSAYFYGNEIGIHIEICGTVQTRAQWLDAVSMKTLKMAAALTREICLRHGFQMRRLTIQETYNAYFGKDKPTGINDHAAITQAFNTGDHMDVGAEFPWDVFMPMVIGEEQPDEWKVKDEMPRFIARSGDENSNPPTAEYWLGDGYYHRKIIDKGAAESMLAIHKQYGFVKDDAQILSWDVAPAEFVQSMIGPTPYLEGGSEPGGGLSFDQTVEAARQGAELAEDS